MNLVQRVIQGLNNQRVVLAFNNGRTESILGDRLVHEALQGGHLPVYILEQLSKIPEPADIWEKLAYKLGDFYEYAFIDIKEERN